MPGRDGTGPQGQGSRTGRGLGNCSPGQSNARQVNYTGTRPFYGQRSNFWNATFGRLFLRRRGGRNNRI